MVAPTNKNFLHGILCYYHTTHYVPMKYNQLTGLAIHISDYLLDRKFKRMPRKPKASKTFRRLKCKESVNKGSEPSSTGWGSGCTNPTPGFESSRRRI